MTKQKMEARKIVIERKGVGKWRKREFEKERLREERRSAINWRGEQERRKMKRCSRK